MGEIFRVNNFCPETVCRCDNCSVPIRNVMFSFQRDRFENEIAIDRDDWKASQALDELQRLSFGEWFGDFLRCCDVEFAEDLCGCTEIHSAKQRLFRTESSTERVMFFVM